MNEEAIGLLGRLRVAYRKKGLAFVAVKIVKGTLRRLKNFWLGIYLNLRPPRYFVFQGQRLRYLFHRYNTTWENERSVEVPIVLHKMHEIGITDKRVLEVGNVLNYYFPFPHDIIDKYEISKGVINEDVVNFVPNEPYDVIVSISTMEHVGWDESPREPRKIIRGFENLISNCLAPAGRLIVTLPLGYNTALDEYLQKGQLQFSEVLFMKRIASDCAWTEVTYDKVIGARYNQPFPFANAIMIGIYQKPS
jgi:hypothetical protein